MKLFIIVMLVAIVYGTLAGLLDYILFH